MVDLLPDARLEMTSWAEIGLAAMELLEGCLDGEKSAGSTVAGPNDKVQITISKWRE